MKFHEHQAKQVLRQFGVPTPKSGVCFSVKDAMEIAQKIGGSTWVVKAQIHAGGRGKGGGVKVAKTLSQVEEYASKILGMQLKTHQTSPDGQFVHRLLIEEGVSIANEYLSLIHI